MAGVHAQPLPGLRASRSPSGTGVRDGRTLVASCALSKGPAGPCDGVSSTAWLHVGTSLPGGASAPRFSVGTCAPSPFKG